MGKSWSGASALKPRTSTVITVAVVAIVAAGGLASRSAALRGTSIDDGIGGVSFSLDPGDVDPTLGGFTPNGIVAVGFSAFGVAVQDDGKIVVAGTEGGLIKVRRYLPTGVPDNGFGHNSYNDIAIPGKATDIAVMPDGRLAVVGDVADDSIVVLRLLQTGSLDRDFGYSGIRIVDESGKVWSEAIALQDDGKIVVAGRVLYSEFSSDEDFWVVRLTPGGDLDKAFDEDGVNTNGFSGFCGQDWGRDVSIQPDGKMVVVGTADDNAYFTWDMDIGVAHYNSHGSLDDSFSLDGKAKIGFGDFEEEGGAVALQPDGMILIIRGHDGNDTDFSLVRYESGLAPPPPKPPPALHLPVLLKRGFRADMKDMAKTQPPRHRSSSGPDGKEGPIRAWGNARDRVRNHPDHRGL